MFKVLFVCTGNTCRSCMAQGIFNSMIKKEGLEHRITSLSAGIDAIEGDTASRNAVSVLYADYGIDISSHSARFLTKEMINDADLILTMTRNHKNILLSYYPELSGKVFTLKEYAADSSDIGLLKLGPGLDIPDPFGMGHDSYRECARQMEILSSLLLKKLEK